jgi:hypothetical protein
VGKFVFPTNVENSAGIEGTELFGFCATPTESPNNEQGVAFECRDAAECAALLQAMGRSFCAGAFYQ